MSKPRLSWVPWSRLRSTTAPSSAIYIGGIFNTGVFAGSVAELTINNSTISGNNFADGSGGGITTGGIQGGSGITSINSSTISGNRAHLSPGFAGGVAALGWDSGSNANVIIRNSTITANDAPSLSSRCRRNDCRYSQRRHRCDHPSQYYCCWKLSVGRLHTPATS